MAKRVTEEDILFINTVYFACKNKAETARKTGWSAGTVTRYLIDGFVPKDEVVEESTPITLPEFDKTLFQTELWNDLTILSPLEIAEVKEFRKELVI